MKATTTIAMTLKMNTTPKMKTTTKIKMTPKIKKVLKINTYLDCHSKNNFFRLDWLYTGNDAHSEFKED